MATAATDDRIATIGYMATTMPKEMQRMLYEPNTLIASLKHGTSTGRALIVVR